MKKLEAIIQPFKLQDVLDALKAAGVAGLTVSEVKGHGRQKGHKEVYRGMEYNVDDLPKTKLELVAPEDRVNEILSILMRSARTGKIGDGKIFVYAVEDARRIRNGDGGEAAL